MLLVAMAFCAVYLGHYSNDLGAMFPKGSQSGRMYASLQGAGLTEAIQLDFDCGGQGRAEELGDQLLALHKELMQLPGIAKVKFIMLNPEALSLAPIIQALPLTTEASVLDKANPSKAANAASTALSIPGVPIAPLRLDPFGLGASSLKKLESLGAIGGFMGRLSNKGFIMDAEGRHALMLLWARDDKSWDAKSIRVLFEGIENLCARILPAEVKVSIISPLRHTLENEETVRRDVLYVSIASAIVLLLLFLLVYRHVWEALWIPLLPFAATLISVGIFAIFCRDVCLFVLGIGGAIAGLAVDQGIHVFAAYKGERGEDRLRTIFKPLLLSTLTSAVVFLSLLASGVKAYMQLGAFAALTLLLNLFLSYFVLPTLLSKHTENSAAIKPFSPGRKKAAAICALWMIVLIAGVFSLQYFMPQLAMNKLDGSKPDTFKEEAAFQERWKNTTGGIPSVISGRSEEIVYTDCEEMRKKLDIPEDFVIHPGQIWPPQLWREANLETWTSEKAKARLSELEENLRQELAAKNLPPTFYKPFFDGIRKGMEEGLQMRQPDAYAAITEYYVSKRNGRVNTMVFIPRNTGFAQREEQEKFIIRTCPSAALVSPTAFQAAAA
ncbi:MAG: hypothetical protein IJS08_01620, partial [Victivallales bacterium]|nr:hypothetical protein [Victivallales bacterium]